MSAGRAIIWDGVFSRLMDTLSGGVFLAGLAIALGSSTFTLAVLAALPFLAQVAQFPAVKIMLYVSDRRRIVIWASGLARFGLFGVAAWLLFGAPGFSGLALVGILAVMALLAVVSSAAWNWWVRDLVPRDELGRFFGRRLRIMTVGASVALLAAGVFLDHAESTLGENVGYAVLFAVAGVFGFASIYFLHRTPHSAPREPHPPGRAFQLMIDALRTPSHRRMAQALALVSATLAFALPFTAIYLLKELGLGFLPVTALALVSLLAYTSSLRAWGHLSDRLGSRPVLEIAVGLLAVALVGWTVSWTPSGLGLLAYLAVIHFLSGFAIAGVDLAGTNIIYKTAPPGNVLAYLAGQSLVKAMAAGLATLAAGALWQGLGTTTWSIPLPLIRADLTWGAFHLLAFLSVLLGLLSLALLPTVVEEGSAPVVDVARAMRREVRMLSSVSGIRAFVHVVSYAVEFLATPRSRRRDAPRPKAEPPPSPP